MLIQVVRSLQKVQALRNKKQQLVFMSQSIGQDNSRKGQYNCPYNSHFPAGIRFSQEEFCRSSGEHILQAKSIRESCSVIALEIAVPNPGSEGENSIFIPGIEQDAQRRFLWRKQRSSKAVAQKEHESVFCLAPVKSSSFYSRKSFLLQKWTHPIVTIEETVRKQGEQESLE